MRYRDPHPVLFHGAVAKLGSIPDRRIMIEAARPLAGVALDLALLGRYDEIENLPRLLLLAICDLRLRSPECTRTEKLHRFRTNRGVTVRWFEITAWCLVCGGHIHTRRVDDLDRHLQDMALLSDCDAVLRSIPVRDHCVPCALKHLAFTALPFAPSSKTRKPPPKRERVAAPGQAAFDLEAP